MPVTTQNQLFIERIIQLLKDGGRAAIVLPDSILGAPGLEYIRYWMIKNTKVVCSVGLHAPHDLSLLNLTQKYH